MNRQRGIRLLLGLIAGVVVLAAGGLLLLHTRAVQRSIWTMIQTSLEAQGIRADGELYFSIWSSTLDLRSLSLRRAADPAPDPFLRAERFDMDIDFVELAAGRVSLRRGVVTRPELNLVISGAARNVPDLSAGPTPSGSPPPAWFIGHLDFVHGQLRVQDQVAGVDASIAFEGSIEGDPVSKVHQISFSDDGPGVVRVGDLRIDIRRLSLPLAVSSDQKTLGVHGATLSTSVGDISVAGTASLSSPSAVDLQVRAVSPLEDLASAVGADPLPPGTIELRGSVRGPLDSITTEAEVRAEVRVAAGLSPLSLSGTVTWAASDGVLRTSGLDVRSQELRASVSAMAAIRDADTTSSAEVLITSLDLGRVSIAMESPLAIASVAQGRLAASWKGTDPGTLVAGGRLTMTPKAGPGVAAFGSVEASWSPTGLTVRSDLEAASAQLTGDASVRADDGLTGRLQISAGDLATFRNALVKAGVAGLPIGDVSGRADLAANLAGTRASPAIHWELRSTGLAAGSIRGAHVDAVGEASRASLRVSKSALSWAGATLNLSGDVTWNAPSPLLDLQLDGTVDALGRLVAPFAPSVPVDGRLEIRGALSGSLSHPEGSVAVRARDLHVFGVTTDRLSAEVAVNGRVVEVRNLTLNRGAATGTASLRFDGEHSGIDAGLQLTQFPIDGFHVSGGPVAEGRVDLELQASGVLPNPDLQGALRLTGFGWNGQRVGEIDATMSMSGGVVRATGRVPEWSTRLELETSVASPRRTSATLITRALDLGRLARAGILPILNIEGELSARVSAVGDLDTPDSWQADLEVEPLTIHRDRVEASVGAIRGAVRDGRLTIDPVDLTFTGGSGRIGVRMPLSRDGSGIVEVSGSARLEDLARAVIPENVVLGLARWDGQFRYRDGTWDPQLTLRVDDAAVPQGGLSGVSIDAEAANGRLSIRRATGALAAGAVDAMASFPLSWIAANAFLVTVPQAPADFRLGVTGVQLNALPGAPPGVAGTVSFEANGIAQTPDISSIDATVRLPDLRIKTGDYEIQQSGVSEFRIRNGGALIEALALEGPQTRLEVGGRFPLVPAGAFDLRISGSADAAIASLALPDLRAAGPVAIAMSVEGTGHAPSVRGTVTIEDGQVAWSGVPVEVDNLDVRVALNGRKAVIESLRGEVNGGSLEGRGEWDATRLDLAELRSQFEVRGAYLNYPEGLRTVSDADLVVDGSSDQLLLSGVVTIRDGAYRESLAIERGLLGYLQSPGTVAVPSTGSPTTAIPINLQLAVRTESPIVVETDVATAEITADLRIAGTADRPGITGRLQVGDGGELTLRERRFQIERAVVTFASEDRIQALLDVSATTRVSGHSVQMTINGDPTAGLETVLTSDPALPEADIVSLLATGRTLADASAAGADVAREQVLSYLAGGLGGSLTDQAGRAVGLSQFRIEPSLIAAETEPTARLTIGKDFTRQADFVYSMNLRNSADQIWTGSFDVSRSFSARATRQNDDSYRVQFQHDLRLGGATEPAARALVTSRVLGRLTFTGNSPFDDARLTDLLGFRPGKAYDFFALRRGLERIRQQLLREGFLEGRVTTRRSDHDGRTDLEVAVAAGPKVTLEFGGWGVSAQTRQRIADGWGGSVIDAQRLRQASAHIEDELRQRGFRDASVESAVIAETDSRRVLFEIDPGPTYSRVEFRFNGAAAFGQDQLSRLLQDAALPADPVDQWSRAAALLRDHYADSGYLDSQVIGPEIEWDAGQQTVRAAFSVTEGPLYRMRRVSVAASRLIDGMDRAGGLEAGTVASPRVIAEAARRLREFAGERGFVQNSLTEQVRRDPVAAAVDVDFTVRLGPQRILGDVQIEGHGRTGESLLRSQLGVEEGDPVGVSTLSRARRNLYALGAFSLVQVEAVPAATSGGDAETTPVRLIVRVRELPPFEVRYGAFFDTERGPGGIVDVSSRNWLGGARSTGLRTRYDADLRELRAYFTQPELPGLPVKALSTVFVRREVDPDFITDRIGVSGNLEWKFKSSYVVAGGYRFERAHTFERSPDPLFPFDIRLRVAPLTATFTRDTRDDPIDASRGSLTSHALEWAPEKLGSELRFLKYFGQYFRYQPLMSATRVPWSGEVRSRLVAAWGGRFGAARGLGGQQVVRSERFFAGGGTTVRGFDQDTLGPLDFRGQPVGGNATATLNAELRFPAVAFIDGVGFLDAGNVYRRAVDFRLSDLRYTAGAGLRVRTPYVVLRLDYGFILGRLPGERLGRFFFSIGQAF